jgi:hypothetical protein
MNAWARSQAFWHKERKATVAALRKTLGDRMKGFDDQTLEEMIYIYNHDRTALTEADKVDIRNTSAFMHDRKTLKSMPDIEKLIDNRFATKADSQVSYK